MSTGGWCSQYGILGGTFIRRVRREGPGLKPFLPEAIIRGAEEGAEKGLIGLKS
jgi:hypothetical protein